MHRWRARGEISSSIAFPKHLLSRCVSSLPRKRKREKKKGGGEKLQTDCRSCVDILKRGLLRILRSPGNKVRFTTLVDSAGNNAAATFKTLVKIANCRDPPPLPPTDHRRTLFFFDTVAVTLTNNGYIRYTRERDIIGPASAQFRRESGEISACEVRTAVR